MAESPNPSRPGSAPGEPSSPTASRLSVPPSEPRPSRASLGALDAQADRPARVQLIVALLLGLVLVAIPLYLWRRPRAESIVVTTAQDAGVDPTAPPGSPLEEKMTVDDAKVVACHDPGPKKTAPEQCDHLPELEKALAKAIEDNAACVPKDAGGGTIAYVLEVSFRKKSVTVSTPKESRSFRNVKVVGACQAVVKGRMKSVSLDETRHEHQRYRISVTARYPGAVKP